MTEFTNYQWFKVYDGRHYNNGQARKPTFECNFRPQTNRWIAHANRLGNINDKPVVYRNEFLRLTDNLKRMVSWSLKEDKKVRIIVINKNKIIYWKDGRKFYINGFPVLKTTILNCMNILFTHARRCKVSGRV